MDSQLSQDINITSKSDEKHASVSDLEDVQPIRESKEHHRLPIKNRSILLGSHLSQSDTQSCKIVNETSGSQVAYLCFIDSYTGRASKVKDLTSVKNSQIEKSKVLDNQVLTASVRKEDTEEPLIEIEVNGPSKLTGKAKAGKIMMIVFYYMDIFFIYWTAEMMAAMQNWWYFGCMMFFILAFLYQNIKFNFRDIANPYKAFLLGLAHVEYIYFQFCYGEKDINPKKKSQIEAANTNPLCSREFYKILFGYFPMCFVFTHLMFVENNTSLIIQLSVTTTILYACLGLMYVIISCDKTFKKINLKQVYIVLGVGSHAFFEMCGLMFLWGFYSILTKPWGALLFFPLSLIIWCIICGLLEGTNKKTFHYMFYTSFSPIATTYKVGFYLRIVQCLFFGVIFAIKRHELVELLEDQVWFWYFIAGWGCILLWFLNSLYFYPHLKTAKEENLIMSVRNSLIMKNENQVHTEALLQAE